MLESASELAAEGSNTAIMPNDISGWLHCPIGSAFLPTSYKGSLPCLKMLK